MAENRVEVLVGTGVLAVAAGFLIYLLQSTGGIAASSDHIEYSASFRAVDGISVGTEVRLAGVKLGSVTGLSLNADTFRADAQFTLPAEIALPDDSAVVISSEGLLGGNFLEVVPGGSPFTLEPGDEILETQGSVSLVSLLLKFVTGSSE